jgi:ribonuclease G
MELRVAAEGSRPLLHNIYVGQVETISENIQAAFVLLGNGVRGYFPLSEAKDLIYASPKKEHAPLRPGDEILVQVSRDAMKGKLPALTSNLNFTGNYLVLTSANRKIGFSAKLSREEKELLARWVEPEQENPDRDYGIVVRTNAQEASKETFLCELEYLKKVYRRTAGDGPSRTCFSLLYEAEPFYIEAIRDSSRADLTEIVTDDPQIAQEAAKYLEDISDGAADKVRLYTDKLLPLHKLYRLEHAVEEIRSEKVWLKSGGFLVIQQTEAFVVIDVNSGKFTGRKKAQETYRKINIEAAGEIARQLRLRNLSGIILIDFINMENPDHQQELFHVLKNLLKKDPVKSKVIDITPLHILEMTRKKVRRPVFEDLRELETKTGL